MRKGYESWRWQPPTPDRRKDFGPVTLAAASTTLLGRHNCSSVVAASVGLRAEIDLIHAALLGIPGEAAHHSGVMSLGVRTGEATVAGSRRVRSFGLSEGVNGRQQRGLRCARCARFFV